MTAHTDETFARTWSMLQKKKGNHALGLGSTGKGKPVGSVKVCYSTSPSVAIFLSSHRYDTQAVCVSACGNFGIASSSTGAITMWNMQSGMQRKVFSIGPCPSEVATKFRPPPGKKRSDERSITGLATDELNRILIASTLDGTINVRGSSCGICMVNGRSIISYSFLISIPLL